MKKLLVLILAVFLVSFNQNPEKPTSKQKEIKVVTNTTIETFMILRSLSNSDPLFKYRKAGYKGKPLIYSARDYFKDFKNNIAVKKTQEILAETSNTGDLILQGLLYSNELPSTEIKYELNPYWKNREKELRAYLKVLKHFYETAHVEEFLKKNEEFYEGAKKEAQSHLDTRLIPTMEKYFGKTNPDYELIIIPISPFGMGFGANVGTKKNKILYQIISPANDIEWHSNVNDYEEFGYSGKGSDSYYRDLVAHEFCHSFITPLLKQEKYREKINQTDTLFVPELASLMSKQSYENWWSFVNEHLVRLTSIRIENKIGIEDLNQMRIDNVVDKGFILIPDAEELMVKYESNRQEYQTFEDFLPQLINQFRIYTKEDIEEKVAFKAQLSIPDHN